MEKGHLVLPTNNRPILHQTHALQILPSLALQPHGNSCSTLTKIQRARVQTRKLDNVHTFQQLRQSREWQQKPMNYHSRLQESLRQSGRRQQMEGTARTEHHEHFLTWSRRSEGYK